MNFFFSNHGKEKQNSREKKYLIEDLRFSGRDLQEFGKIWSVATSVKNSSKIGTRGFLLRALRQLQCVFEGLEVEVHQAGVVGRVGGGEVLEAAFEVEAKGVAVGVDGEEAAAGLVAAGEEELDKS